MIESSPAGSSASVAKPPDFVRETDYRLATFLAWSKNLQGKRVALYGSGANAQHILEAASRDFDIEAVADDGAVGKIVGTMTVSSLEDALSLGIDTVVMAAGFASIDIVFHRIGDRCRLASVNVIDMYGNDWDALDASISRTLEQPLENQLQIIESCESLCINLDLFLEDTSRVTVTECVHSRGAISQSLNSLVAYSIARGKNVAYYSVSPAMDEQAALALLERMGLTGTGPLFLAAETGVYAESGLYRLMYEHLPEGKTVHIGSEVFRDCLIPLCFGKCSVLTGFIKMPNYLWLISLENEVAPQGCWYDDKLIHAKEPADARLVSCARTIMPEINRDIDASASQVAAIVAPLVVGFTTWLAKQLSQKKGVYDEVLFASRDGHLVKEVYDIYHSWHGSKILPPSRYFYTSRKASRDAILSEDKLHNSLRYFASCGLKLGKTYAFVEFVGAGTCQHQLERFIPFCLTGFYFGSRAGDTITRKFDSSLYFGNDHVSFLSRYLVLEPYLSSGEPSLNGFSDEGKPVFDIEYRTPEELQMLHSVHEGVILFARRYFERWYKEGDVISPAFLNSIMPYLDLCDTDSMTLVDDLSGRTLAKQIDTPAVKAHGCDKPKHDGAELKADSIQGEAEQ